MATDAKKGHDPNAAQTAEAGTAQQPESHAVLAAPVFFKREKSKGKRRKKKYSRGTKPFQRFLLGVSKAGYRTANSFADGLNTFSKRSKKSSKRKRDGFIRDALRNASRGISDGFKELGKAPDEITKRIGTRNVRRVFRVFVNPFSR